MNENRSKILHFRTNEKVYNFVEEYAGFLDTTISKTIDTIMKEILKESTDSKVVLRSPIMDEHEHYLGEMAAERMAVSKLQHKALSARDKELYEAVMDLEDDIEENMNVGKIKQSAGNLLKILEKRSRYYD